MGLEPARADVHHRHAARALVSPVTNAYMSQRIAADAQGELQGAASLYSLSSIVGPPVMSQLFGRFSSADAPAHLPGAAFLAAAICALVCLAIYLRATGRADFASAP
jgi:DHA1 family tetracycline resistance protein-like MFS transporter